MSEAKKVPLIIAEDDPSMLRLVKKKLQGQYSERLKIIEAPTYLDAITAIAAHKDEILLIISDFHFREDPRNTGVDVLFFAEHVVPRAVLFALSSHDEDSVFADYSRTHHIHYFSKDDLNKLVDAIGKALIKME